MAENPRAVIACAEAGVKVVSCEKPMAVALRSADVAVQGLQPGTVDYLRAQDIAMTSRAAVEQQRKKR